MAERQISRLVAGFAVFLVLAVVWDASIKRRPKPPPASAGADSVVGVRESVAPEPAAATAAAADTGAPRTAGPPAGAVVERASGPGYLELLARAENRRRIRASAGFTYLNEIVAASEDSMLHRWDNRALAPVRVWLTPGTVANYQPAFLDAIRRAFRRWAEVRLPVRFDLEADSSTAEVRLAWRIQFEIDRTGQTDLVWDQNGHLQSGVVTLATFDAQGRPINADDVYVVALHELGHVLGLDHSPDSADLMYPVAKVRDLSARDVETARLLYQLTAGSLR